MKLPLPVFYRAFRLSLLLLLALTGTLAYGQAPAWQTVVTAGQTATGAYTVLATGADAAGNIYMTGPCHGSVSFGATTLTSTGNNYAFVAKWSPVSRAFVWAQQIGGAANTSVQTSALVVSGANVYVGGSFFGTIGVGSTTLTNTGSAADVLVAKITDAGSTSTVVWGQRAGSPDLDNAQSLAVNGSSIYVAGYFTGYSAGFGSTTLLGSGSTEAFVAKLTDNGASGSYAWAQQMGSAGAEVVFALANNGPNVYAAGSFQGTASFGLGTLTSVGGNDIFVVKLLDNGPSGSLVWAQRAGGPSSDAAFALAVAGTTVYMGGSFSGSSAFGPATLTSAGGDDVYIAKMVDSGSSASFVWAQRAGGNNGERVRALALAGTSVYAAGSFQSLTASFGSTALTNADTFFGGSDDMFIAKLTDTGSAGSFAWAQRAGGREEDDAYTLTLAGSVGYMGGFISPIASFGTQSVTSPTGAQIGFLAAYAEGPLATTVAKAESAQFFPNPAHGNVQVHLPQTTGAPEAQITLTNSLGQTVLTQSIQLSTANNADISLRGLAPGVYRFQLQAGRHYFASTLVVQ